MWYLWDMPKKDLTKIILYGSIEYIRPSVTRYLLGGK